MANYDVDIEIALQGAQKITELTRGIKDLSKEVREINKVAKTLGKETDKAFRVDSVDNYSKALRQAERALRSVASGTDAEARAVERVVRIRQESNRARARQNFLIAQEIANQKQAIATANAGFGMQGPSLPQNFFAVQGPKLPRGFTEAGRRPSGGGSGRPKPTRIGTAIQAGGFPLLFGGGPGQAIAGAAAGFLSKDIFGPATIGAQVGGGIIDQTVTALADLGRALQNGEGVVAAYEAAIGRLDNTQKQYLTNLEASGQKQRLYSETVKQANKDLGILGDLFITNAENAATFDRGLGALVNTVKGLAAAPFVFLGTETFGGKDPLKQQEELTQAAKDRLNTAQKEKVALQFNAKVQGARLELSRNLTQSNIDQLTAAQKAEANQKRQAAIETIRAQENQGILEPKLAQQEAEKVSIRYNRELKDIENTRLQNLELLAKQTARLAAEQARVAADLARRETDSLFKKETARAQANLGIIQAGIVRKQLLDDDKAALQQIINSEEDRLANEKILLAVSNAKLKTSLALDFSEEEIAGITQRRVFLLEEESRIRKLNAEKAIKQIELERQLLALQNQQTTQNIEVNLTRDLADAQQRVATPFASSDSEMLDLRIKQVRRAEDVQTDLNNKLATQEKLLESTDKNVRNAASVQIKVLKERVALYGKLLPQLDAVEQAELRQKQILEKVQPVADAVAQGIVNVFKSIADGSMSAKEAFANMLNAVADVLLKEAARMIAAYIAIGVARAFAGISGGGETTPPTTIPGSASQSGLGLNINGVDQGISPFGPGSVAVASGGYVSGPTRALVGEGGQGEYIIPENKMHESIARYSRGARGSAVVPEAGASGTSGEGGGTAVAAPIDVRFNVERINNVDYVTAEQFQVGLTRAAQQGAVEGERRAMGSLRNSAAVRRRIGV